MGGRRHNASYGRAIADVSVGRKDNVDDSGRKARVDRLLKGGFSERFTNLLRAKNFDWRHMIEIDSASSFASGGNSVCHNDTPLNRRLGFKERRTQTRLAVKKKPTRPREETSVLNH